MKLRIFEEFVEHTANIGYAKAKMDELQDIVTDTLNDDDSFTWEIEDDISDGYILNVNLMIGGSLLTIEFDMDKLIMGLYANAEHLDFTGHVTSLEEGMDRIEKAIYDHIGIKENKSIVKNDIADQIIDGLLDEDED